MATKRLSMRKLREILKLKYETPHHFAKFATEPVQIRKRRLARDLAPLGGEIALWAVRW